MYIKRSDAYYLATRARAKLTREACRQDHDLRVLVSHANLLDSLMETLNRPNNWVTTTVRETSAVVDDSDDEDVYYHEEDHDDEEEEDPFSDDEMESDDEHEAAGPTIYLTLNNKSYRELPTMDDEDVEHTEVIECYDDEPQLTHGSSSDEEDVDECYNASFDDDSDLQVASMFPIKQTLPSDIKVVC
jgi:hypothetical protein